MEWLQFFALLASLTGFFVFLYKELKDWRNETRNEILEIRHEISQQADRTDRQAERTDKLYEMFIELVKQTKKC